MRPSSPGDVVALAGLVAAGLGLTLTSPTSAQELSPPSPPLGVEVNLIDLSFGIQGRTASELLQGLRSNAPWARFPYTYRWRYKTRRLYSVAGRPTQHCGITDFTIEFTVRAEYPRWENRPDDAPERLRDAWATFEEQLEALWKERQDAMLDFAREARREALRIEEGCPILAQITNDRVQRIHDRRLEREREARADGERRGLRWPPAGYEDLMDETATAAAPEARSTSSAATATRPSAQAARPAGRRPPPLPPPAGTRPAPRGGVVGIEAVLITDVGPEGMLGAVAGLSEAGEIDYLGALGDVAPEATDSLTVDDVLRSTALTEVIVAAASRALADEGLLDLEAPLSTRLPGLSPRLGRITLEDLLSHRSGLDNANPPDSVWTRIIDDLDDRAVFTEPGVIDSYSRYDYPLAIRVLEAVARTDISALARRLVFEPVGMGASSLVESRLGIPTTHSTVQDLLTLGEALMAGSVLAPPEQQESLWAVESDELVYFGGLLWDAPQGVRRIRLMCEAGADTDALAFQVYPEQEVVQALWARRRSVRMTWPETVARLVLEDLGARVGLGQGVFEPRTLKGAAEVQVEARSCRAPSWHPLRVTEVGPSVAAGDWAGSYTNGDRRLALEDREGRLWMNNDMALRVTEHEGDVHFAAMNDVPLYPFRLVTDEEGRRYVVLHGRAYLHDDDRLR